jgi:nuclear factor related to kappa-B-binding protein
MRSAPIHHVLLKTERPPFVSILSIVRDAVARLPDGIGTRTDVVELCKESQYLATGTMDENLMSMTIGGGLDRLQAEEDPGCRFDPNTRLWVNLHRNRKVDDPKLNFSYIS